MTFIHVPVRDSLYRLSYSVPDRDLELEGQGRALNQYMGQSRHMSLFLTFAG